MSGALDAASLALARLALARLALARRPAGVWRALLRDNRTFSPAAPVITAAA